MLRYALTIFLSAFLLFQVQPLIAKTILPWFGGSPAVWSTCMLFFQVVLLLGYSYAHLIASRLPGRMSTALHIALLLASLALLPIAPSEAWKPAGDEFPVGRILALLMITIGLPYFLLSSTGPLLQEGFRRETGRTPYRLYSLSNAGSLLALVSYPFLFEPQLTLRMQIGAWSVAYVAFAGLCAWCALGFLRPAHASVEAEASFKEPAPAERPGARQILQWLGLAACGSVMLLATTNQLCLEVSSVPFLWIVPLAVYLLSFIICFDHQRWYHRNTFLVLLTLAVLLASYGLSRGNELRLWQQIAIYSSTLFVCCMVCHGELVLAKPAARFATLFYLMVAAGGALGGVLVALVAPLVLPDFWEYHLGLVGTVLAAFLIAVVSPGQAPRREGAARVTWIAGGIVSVVLGMVVGLSLGGEVDDEEVRLERTRNFYGVLRVNREESLQDDNGAKHELKHGTIQHGFQYLDSAKRRWPTTYYGRTSGVGLAIEHQRHKTENAQERSLRIGVVGLGCGTLAAYGQEGDYLRFYEINPEVIRISDAYFSYRKDCPAKLEIALGDARIQMEREREAGQRQAFDVLAVDAFSSDSIPMHLLTKEAVQLYFDHLKPDGLLCLHISNRFLDLRPVVRGIARDLGYECEIVYGKRDSQLGTDVTRWAILARSRAFLDSPAVAEATKESDADESEPPPIVWTDDYGSLWQVLDDG